jgi:glutaredoxin
MHATSDDDGQLAPSVVLYGRDGCCLCDEVRAALERLRSRYVFVLQERDIDKDEQLQRRYLERIPVIAINGVERFQLVIAESELERALAAASGVDEHQ